MLHDWYILRYPDGTSLKVHRTNLREAIQSFYVFRFSVDDFGVITLEVSNRKERHDEAEQTH